MLLNDKDRRLLLHSDEVPDGPEEAAEPELAGEAEALLLEALVEAAGESVLLAHVVGHGHAKQTLSRRVIAPAEESSLTSKSQHKVELSYLY